MTDIKMLVAENDRKNLAVIEHAFENGRINDEARKYLKIQYSDSMKLFRDVFSMLAKCFGVPKAAVAPYNYETNSVIDVPMKIADINPLSPYMVHHRLDADPMRNQFFSITHGHKIELSVSSIVSVIVGAQKNINRAMEKITESYYDKYIEDVADTAKRIISENYRASSGDAIAEKIRKKFRTKFITNTSETVLEIIGPGHEKVAVELVRALDKIKKPHLQLQDVWRVKCLFDLIPQARIFIERIRELYPDKIINIRDNFFDTTNPRNYRDAKIILNIGNNGEIIPLEIICQVRIIFESEIKTHKRYELSRKSKGDKTALEVSMTKTMAVGIDEYNTLIYNCLDDLFDRAGWNILYSEGDGELLFDGFPKISKQYYPQKILDNILAKLDNAVQNEVFYLPTAPVKLTPVQEMEIFRWMAKFVLVSAMPPRGDARKLDMPGMHGKLFNFIIKELNRYLIK